MKTKTKKQKTAKSKAVVQTPKYRLLCDKDIITEGDDFLDDDCQTWTKIYGPFVGMRYLTGIHLPVRRKV